MASEFRIQTVAIEGFKGFTARQEIALDGRHTFLLGQNGNGKSSVVEAIRWGLFGSTGRPGEIVANRNYAVRCRVEIALLREGKLWHLRRTMRPGGISRSEPVLTDDSGKEHRIGDIMPQLASVDAGEGMHIIFAPQATQLRRQPDNLSPFEKIVFNHLGLTLPRVLLRQLDDFLSDQEPAETTLGGNLDKVRHDVDRDIDDLQRQRGTILNSPPWGSGHAPTVADSQNKARSLIEEITGAPIVNSLDGVSLDALNEYAEKVLQAKSTQDKSTLVKTLSEIVEQKEYLETYRRALQAVEEQLLSIKNAQSELDTTLGGASFDELHNRIRETRSSVNSMAMKRRIAESAIELINDNPTDSVHCPLCEVEHLRQDLEPVLQQAVNQQSDTEISILNNIEETLHKAEVLKNEVDNLNAALSDMRQQVVASQGNLHPGDSRELINGRVPEIICVDEIIKKYIIRENSINSQIAGQESWITAMTFRLSKIKDEERFHQIQNRLTGALQARNRFEQVQTAYDDFVAFGETVREIRDVVEACLNERLKEDTPKISENLSQAFAALTHHPWYDRLTIAQDKLPGLELQVASSQDPLALGHPTAVLNGQAESALDLVPYFAFSQADDTPTEVYLVMLDDPTRAFDQEHIETLIKRLAELGRYVQLVVASHETNRFQSLIPTSFKSDSYVIVEPTGWSHHGGPTLHVRYG